MGGKIAIVTGTSSGIGRALAEELVGRDWLVIGVSRRPVDVMTEKYQHVREDLADLAKVEHSLLPALERHLAAGPWRRVALVNSAADPGQMRRLDRLDGERLNQLLVTNLVAPVLLIGMCIRALPRETSMRVVNLSSGAATVAYAALGDYAVSKAGLRMAGMIAAEEAEGREWPDYAVVSYAPGAVDTPMQALARSQPPEAFPLVERFRALHAAGSLVGADAVASDIAMFLEEASPARFSERRYSGGSVRLTE
jgi:benzil reductase ((S)-benzoin forming)